MAVEYANGRIITNGLVLSLDATDKTSYPGSGNTWLDVSGNGKNFTLDAGISFNSIGNFSLVNSVGATYNGSITTSTNCTVQIWIKTTDDISLFLSGNDGSYYLGAYRVGNKEYYSNCGSPNYFQDTIDVSNIYDSISDGRWHMAEFKNVNFSTWTTFNFNKYTDYMFGNGNIASLKIYDRSLSSDESLQNYNAQKSRFGLS
jgi:hypothetical protein